MKEEEHKYDYTESEYDVVPEWVHEFMEDRLQNGVVISRGSGEWIHTGYGHVVDLEEHR